MANYVQPGKIINYKNDTGANIAYGDVVVLSSRIGVAECGIANGEIGSVGLEGVYEFPAETTAAFAVGQKIYWDDANKRLTATEGTIFAGIAVEAKASADDFALVKM
ncbi:hypothetical protein CAFE_17740 [Caprobacter fermentans]|uniref:DUF2190 family protein n=1 Tax=Caproicibacter fermentans TaxID=2576756 RepID=A0A6N8HZ77_9FIRM|nr:DUF2190 family protein [Caproicibacter fermentans]MVB11072.1 hypothetical protein [Caproicibacter fermentans]